MANRSERTRLRQLLVDYFSDEELRTICFDLDVSYDALPGTTFEAKARELVRQIEIEDRIIDLLQVIYQTRPNLFWKTAVDSETQVKLRQALAAELGYDAMAPPTIEVPVLNPDTVVSKTGPLREDYRQLLRLSLERIHKRLDEQGDQLHRVRTLALLALMLVSFSVFLQFLVMAKVWF